VIAQIVQARRGSPPNGGSPPNDVSVTVAELQRIADTSGAGARPPRSIGRLRIMFVAGSRWPWRAIESDDASPHKRMMCFGESEQTQRILVERLDRQRVDEEFVAEHLATPGGLPGITSDWLPSHLFDAVFESHRLHTSEQGYQTTPDRIVKLARTRGLGSR